MDLAVEQELPLEVSVAAHLLLQDPEFTEAHLGLRTRLVLSCMLHAKHIAETRVSM